MAILVYRDCLGKREYIGRVDYERGASASFSYDSDYVRRSLGTGRLGISERLPLDESPYTAEEFGPFFRGLLPEGEVYGNLAELYQVPRNDYLSILEQLGCESICALTFVSDKVDPDEYEPRYEPLKQSDIESLSQDPIRAVTSATSATRLSLSGAQSKIAWYLPESILGRGANPTDWFVPRGTAPSTHIVKISRSGESDIALNELACSIIARSCGIDVAEVMPLEGIPGAIAVRRYDRIWVDEDNRRHLVRLHQEDFCQALGFPPYLKYQVEGTDDDYVLYAADLIDAVSSNPRADRLEYAKRLVFNFAVGNSDAHLKNSSFLYNAAWTGRRLAPMYDVTCIPLTGYSTRMAHTIGEHRELGEIDEHDVMSIALDADVRLDDFDRVVGEVVKGFDSSGPCNSYDGLSSMLERILDDSSSRVRVLRSYLGR